MTENRPYQGYPYVNPVVIDAPSIDPAAAAKWANLPRRPIGLPRNTESRPGSSREIQDNQSKIPADGPKPVHSRPNKNNTDDTPVVYIDLPDICESSVLETPREGNEQREEAFVQDTILYDPFKDRRIELRVTNEDSEDEDTSRGDAGNEQRAAPSPPNTLQLASPGSSSGYTSSPTFGTSMNPNLPAFALKEAGYYGNQPLQDDGFPLSQIPVADFPEPPPAYTEFDRVEMPSTVQSAPPRTEVITTVTDPTTTIRPGSDRKLLQCQHCGQRVHSLVVTESGTFTHIIAIIFAILCLIPVVILIYCTDGCKYKNHYCPNCNQLIGYEIPILCQQMAFV
ncbi:uncharacterized protein [Battus philenor]|uniref:uncharacterized protein n=1 Tax=Battus philenor TaxID=42288 RepID=UPI0035D07EA8